MADNTTLNTGTGGDSIATDDIAGVKYPRSKIVIGADGTNDGDVSATNPLPVKGTGTAGAANAGVVTVQGIASMTALQVADNSGSLTVDAPVGTPVFVRLSDGSAAIATLPVSLASVPSHAVTNVGTFAVQSAGDVAHDSADSGSPIKAGAKAVTSLSGLTMVTANDRTNLHAGTDGVLITRPHCNLEDIVTGNASNTDGTSTSCIAASGDAAIKHYLTSVTITNTSSSMIYVELKSGTTVMYTLPVPATGGVTKDFSVPLKPNAANEAWSFDPSAATATVYASMIGFKSKI